MRCGGKRILVVGAASGRDLLLSAAKKTSRPEAAPTKATNFPRAQSGIALLTALLIIALATTAAIAMAARQQLDIRRTANTLQRDQAYVYAVSAEVMAREVLRQDDAKVDEKEEDWSAQKLAIPFQGGVLAGSVEDLQGRFNLNNLVKGGVRSNHDFERFKRLLQILKEKSEQREVWENAEPADLANAVVDWIDTDSNPSPGGAEDTDYLQGERPYRVANTLLTSTSELLLVRGFTAPIYNQIAPYVTALPERTKLNVNTAKADVLRAYGEDTSCVDVPKLGRAEETESTAAAGADTTKSKTTVFKSADEFWQHDAIAGCVFVGVKNKNKNRNAAPKAAQPDEDAAAAGATATTNTTQTGADDPADAGKVDPAEVFSVFSNYFLVNAYAEVGPDDHRVRVKLYSTLHRADGKIATLSRMQGIQ